MAITAKSESYRVIWSNNGKETIISFVFSIQEAIDDAKRNAKALGSTDHIKIVDKDGNLVTGWK